MSSLQEHAQAVQVVTQAVQEVAETTGWTLTAKPRPGEITLWITFALADGSVASMSVRNGRTVIHGLERTYPLKNPTPKSIQKAIQGIFDTMALRAQAKDRERARTHETNAFTAQVQAAFPDCTVSFIDFPRGELGSPVRLNVSVSVRGQEDSVIEEFEFCAKSPQEAKRIIRGVLAIKS